MSSQSIPNSLRIAEPELLKYHNPVISCFVQNNIPFEANYMQEPDPAFNSTVFYTIQTSAKRLGFIGCPDGKFIGSVVKDEKFKYFLSEGFGEDSFEEKMFSDFAPTVMHFVCMLAFDRVSGLAFNLDLIEEFERVMEDKRG